MKFSAIFASVFLLAGTPAVSGPLFASDTPEFGLETLALVRATEALFDAIELESAQPASGAPSIQIRPVVPEADPAALPEASRHVLRPEFGELAYLTAYQVTWYPTERLAGTVDFVGTWENGRNLVCGYVTWDLTDPTTPTLAAMTTSYLDTSTLLRLPADAAHGELLRANCAFGEIEPNLALVRPAS